EGVELGEAFAFLSGLYFRGKLAYARAFGRRSGDAAPALVITTDRGLAEPHRRIRRSDLLDFAAVDLSAGDERYRGPFARDVEALAVSLADSAHVVLLGSIATG